MAAKDPAAQPAKDTPAKDAPAQPAKGQAKDAQAAPSSSGQEGQVRGGRLADLAGQDAQALPEGVPWATANEPLYIANPEAAAAPVRAFNPGDRVPAELIERFGWHELVTVPEWATAPPAPATSSEEQK